MHTVGTNTEVNYVLQLKLKYDYSRRQKIAFPPLSTVKVKVIIKNTFPLKYTFDIHPVLARLGNVRVIWRLQARGLPENTRNKKKTKIKKIYGPGRTRVSESRDREENPRQVKPQSRLILP